MKRFLFVLLVVSFLLPATAGAEGEFYNAGGLKEQLELCLVDDMKTLTKDEAMHCGLAWGFVRGITVGALTTSTVLSNRGIENLELRIQLRTLHSFLKVAPQGYLNSKPAAHAVLDALIQTHEKK